MEPPRSCGRPHSGPRTRRAAVGRPLAWPRTRRGRSVRPAVSSTFITVRASPCHRATSAPPSRRSRRRTCAATCPATGYFLQASATLAPPGAWTSPPSVELTSPPILLIGASNHSVILPLLTRTMTATWTVKPPKPAPRAPGGAALAVDVRALEQHHGVRRTADNVHLVDLDDAVVPRERVGRALGHGAVRRLPGGVGSGDQVVVEQRHGAVQVMSRGIPHPRLGHGDGCGFLRRIGRR